MSLKHTIHDIRAKFIKVSFAFVILLTKTPFRFLSPSRANDILQQKMILVRPKAFTS